MLKLYVSLQNFVSQPLRRDERGATAVEYGLIVSLIFLAIVGAMSSFGVGATGVINRVSVAIVSSM